jgi:uncharacterized protein (DUF305 family)
MGRQTLSLQSLGPALTAALLLSACSSAMRAPAAEPTPEARQLRTSPEAIAKAQRDSMRLPYTEADIHFMSGMIAHHAQAIDMARLAPTNAANHSVRVLAERIINAQEDEIFTMQQWLLDRNQPVPEAKAGPMKMRMNGHVHEMLMPGMLTDAQMKQLREARGADFDELFLEYMIQHHRGAVAMVKELFGTVGAGQDETVFKFASDVNVDQTTEIARMERMLFLLRLERKPS